MKVVLDVYSVRMGRCEGFMEAGYGEVVAGCEVRREDAPMDAGLDSMHPLDPPPPDVLLALLARNKALEGRCTYIIPETSLINFTPRFNLNNR